MLSRLLLVAGCSAVACAAFAQTPTPVAASAKPVLGRAADVQGEATVFEGRGANGVLPNTPVVDRSRFTTGANGRLTLKMNKGCEIALKPRQTYLVEEEKVCRDACYNQALDTEPSKEVLGRAARVEGLVTVSDAKGVSRVLLNSDVIDRSRYVTSSSGSATLKMEKGCDIELKPNQAITIDHERSCACLLAMIEPLGAPTTISPFMVGGAILLLLGGGGPAVIAGVPGPIPEPPPGGVTPPPGGNDGSPGVIPNPPISNQ
jgi:hypothetical protein